MRSGSSSSLSSSLSPGHGGGSRWSSRGASVWVWTSTTSLLRLNISQGTKLENSAVPRAAWRVAALTGRS